MTKIIIFVTTRKLSTLILWLYCCMIYLNSGTQCIWFTFFFPSRNITDSNICLKFGYNHSTLQSQVSVGVSAIFCSIWLSRNAVVFDKKKIYSYLQIIFRATHVFLPILRKKRNWARMQMGVSHVEDNCNGDFCQVCVAII